MVLSELMKQLVLALVIVLVGFVFYYIPSTINKLPVSDKVSQVLSSLVLVGDPLFEGDIRRLDYRRGHAMSDESCALYNRKDKLVARVDCYVDGNVGIPNHFIMRLTEEGVASFQLMEDRDQPLDNVTHAISAVVNKASLAYAEMKKAKVDKIKRSWQ